MWPFKRRNAAAIDRLTEQVDLAPLAPFTDAEMFIINWPNAVADSYALAIAYQARAGQRVYVVHAPNYLYGGSMETHCEWLGTAVRQRDPQAIALFLSWVAVRREVEEPELIQVWFTPNPAGVSSPSRTYLMGDGTDGEPELQNVFTRPKDCLYSNVVFGPRLHPDQLSTVLGCPVEMYRSEAAWEAAADQVDPQRRQRAVLESAAEEAHAARRAWFKEMGIDGDNNPEPQQQTQLEPAPELMERLDRLWAQEPAQITAEVGGGIGGANVGHLDLPAPVVSLFLPEEAKTMFDFATFTGIDAQPPAERRVRLWSSNLLTVEQGEDWRLIVFTGADLFPEWWFDAAIAQNGPPGVVTVHYEDNFDAGQQIDLNALVGPVGLAYLEDCRHR